jgi:hypothetical protein
MKKFKKDDVVVMTCPCHYGDIGIVINCQHASVIGVEISNLPIQSIECWSLEDGILLKKIGVL